MLIMNYLFSHDTHAVMVLCDEVIMNIFLSIFIIHSTCWDFRLWDFNTPIISMGNWTNT